jgi:hypothetical protein
MTHHPLSTLGATHPLLAAAEPERGNERGSLGEHRPFVFAENTLN